MRYTKNRPAERTQLEADLKANRVVGDKGGRPAKLSPKDIKTIPALLRTAEMPVGEIAARFGVARSNLYRTILKPVA